MKNNPIRIETVFGIFALFVSIQGIVYFFYRLTPLTAALSFIAAAFLILWIFKTVVADYKLGSVLDGWFTAVYSKFKNHHWRIRMGRDKPCSYGFIFNDSSSWLFAVVTIVGDLTLLAGEIILRSDEALRSPWDILFLPAIILFLASTWTLLLFRRERTDWLATALTILHCFVAWSVAEIIFALGFGFDPFIHRTAEAHIAAHGALFPKQPFYNGQYAAVLGLHWLTGLPVDLIDRWLVPVLAAISLPYIIDRCRLPLGRLRTPGLLLFTLLPLTFTTPNNLAFVFLLWAVFTEGPLALIAAMAALVTHPLLGVLAVIAVVGRWCCRRIKRWWLPATGIFLVSALATPIMLIVQNWRQGAALTVAGSLWSRWQLAVGLFTSPAHPFTSGPIDGWDFLYGYQILLPIFLLVIAAVGGKKLWPQDRGLVASSMAVAIGSWIAASLMAVGIVIPGIISFEQSEFALRLVHAAAFVLVPLFLIGLDQIPRSAFSGRLSFAKSAIFLGLAAAMTATWVLTYPQSNKNMPYAGWGVSRADFDAAQSIANHAGEQKYVVLSNQMLSVAALRTFGFTNFSYALPTGEKLYEYFLVAAYFRTDRQIMEEAMLFTQTPLAYFAIHQYEPEFGRIYDVMFKVADRVWSVDAGRVWIFEFHRTP